ncbi:MAG: M48 family metalloprotease [Proteobacteria bacterium]|nr:M48 family metalloprotease [Pseudomonadota bacterium]MBU1688050.1 M48 family metalloprotease [Pseudomonadota bacterium]
MTRPYLNRANHFALSFFILITLGLSASVHAQGMTIQAEKEIGEQMMISVRQQFKLFNDPDLTRYMNRLGAEVQKAADSPYFDLRVFIVDDKEFNAFAAPSGLIFIHSGLINSIESEDELMSVLAHEGAHVASRHLASRIEKSTKVNIGTVALVLAGIAVGGGPLSEALIAGSMAAGTAMNLKFSRDDEEEADRLAYDWMKKMGRDTTAMLEMMRKMRRISVMQMGHVPPYLLTHPDPAQRMNYIQDLLQINPDPNARGNGAKTMTDFEFQRFSYRILTLSKEPDKLFTILQKKASSPDPKDFMARFGLAELYQKKGNFKEAETLLGEVITRYPEHPMLKTDLGICYLQAGKKDEAAKIIQESNSQDTNNEYTQYQLARVLLQKGDQAQAITLLENLLPKLPEFSRIHYLLGQAQAAQGETTLSHYHIGMQNWLEGNLKAAAIHLQEAGTNLPIDDSHQKNIREILSKIKKAERQ